MDTLLAEMINQLNAVHDLVEKAVIDRPNEALDWTPGPGLNSLGVLLAHTFASERYWIGDVAGEDPSGRVRDEEFVTKDVTLAEFLERSQTTLAHSQSVLSRLALSELGESRVVERAMQGATPNVTVAWAILHGLEHAALHAGHIQITRQLWDQRGQRAD